jgi:hypothetical protein
MAKATRKLSTRRRPAGKVHFAAVAFQGEGSQQVNSRHGRWVEYDGPTEGFASDRVVQVLARLRQRGMVFKDYTRAELRGKIEKELGEPVSRQTIDRVLHRHFGK